MICFVNCSYQITTELSAGAPKLRLCLLLVRIDYFSAMFQITLVNSCNILGLAPAAVVAGLIQATRLIECWAINNPGLFL